MTHQTSTPPEAQIGPYRLLHERGEGAFARAYLAEHPADGRLVVVKVAHQWNPLVEAAFRQEFLLGSRQRHPHLGEVLDHGRTQAGRPFLVLAFDEGEPLLDRPGPWSEPEIIRLGLQLARALAALHAQGLIHRDVSPGNILVGTGGLARLIDFGMLTPAGAAGGAAGTPLYLAPEALNGDAVDARADLYALGAVLYRQACGQAPFEELAPDALLEAALRRTPQAIAQRAPHLTPALAALIMRMLSKDPADRPASASEVAQTLARDAAGPLLPLTEGNWVAPDAWLSWERIAATPGVYAFEGAPGTGLGRCLLEAFRQVRRLDLPALLVSGEEAIGPYALVEAIARWAAALAPEALQSIEPDVRRTLASLWPWLAADEPGARQQGGPGGDGAAGSLASAIAQVLATLLAGVASGGRLALMVDQWESVDSASKALLRKAWAGELASYHWLLASHEPVPEARAWTLTPMPEVVMRPWIASCLHGQDFPGLAARLAHSSGGNPGWAYQALQALHQSGQLASERGGSAPLLTLPASVEATLELQFGHLTLDQRSLAEVLALYAAPFALDDLTPLAGLLPAGWPLELPVLVARGLFDVRGGTYRWVTGWWASFVRDQIPGARAGRLAWDLARALERHWLPSPDAPRSAGLLERLAELYERSDDDEARVRFAQEAGRACALLFANEAALTHYAHGLAALERLPASELQAERRLALLIAQADVRRITGELEAAARTYAACLPEVKSPTQRGRLLVSLGKCHQMLNQFEAARSELEQALNVLSGPEASGERLRGLTTLGRVLFLLGRRDECSARYEEALGLARATGDRAFQAEALSFLGKLMAGQAATASRGLSYLHEALQLREALRDQLGRNDTHMLLGNAFYSQGRFQAAREHFAANLAIALKIGNLSESAFAHINLALCESELGLYADMVLHAGAAATLGLTLKDEFVVGLARFLEAHAALFLGDLALVDASLAIARERERAIVNRDLRLFGLLYEAERHLFMGRFGQAARAGELARGLNAEGVGDDLAARAHLIVAEAWLQEGQTAKAEAALRDARTAIAVAGAVAHAAAAERLAGWLAFRRGDLAEARSRWNEALGVARAEALRPLEIRLLLALHLLDRQDLSRKPDSAVLEAAYALAETARTPEPLALACLGLAIHHLEDGRDLLAERVSRRGHDLVALYTDALPSQGERQAFLAHPERSPLLAAREVEEAYRLQQRGRRLEMLLQLAEHLAASREFEGVLEQVRQFTLEITAAERCLILLQHAPGELRLHGGPDEATYSQTIVQRVMTTRRAECVLDTLADSGLKTQRSILDLRVRSVMCVPMAIGNVLHGVLYVDSRVALGAFTAEDLRVVEAIARQAAVSMDNARMHTLQDHLIKRQKDQIAQLQASDEHIQRLKEWDRVKEEMFEAESHDLRGPVASIKAGVQLLLKGLIGPLSPEQIEMLEGIESNQRQLMAHIDGILDGAKLAAGKLTLALKPVKLDGPVRQAMRVVAPQAAEKGLALNWDPALLAELRVLGDERRLDGILQNLVGNAVKFTTRGSVSVSAGPGRAGYMRILVKDTGPGISAERRLALFERYGASTDTATLAGSGLGLWRVKGLMDALGGTIEVESVTGEGTCFILELPAAP